MPTESHVGVPWRSGGGCSFGRRAPSSGLAVFTIVLGATIVGAVVGRRLRHHVDTLREPFGAVQAALLGLVALVLAFGLTMAVGRYDLRRAAVVDDANAIGTTYLRAQTLREPMREQFARPVLSCYTDTSLALFEGGLRAARGTGGGIAQV